MFDKCFGDCHFKCGDGDSIPCSSKCGPGCMCPSGLYRKGDKCFKKEDCPPTPKGNMSKINEMLTLYILIYIISSQQLIIQYVTPFKFQFRKLHQLPQLLPKQQLKRKHHILMVL